MRPRTVRPSGCPRPPAFELESREKLNRSDGGVRNKAKRTRAKGPRRTAWTARGLSRGRDPNMVMTMNPEAMASFCPLSVDATQCDRAGDRAPDAQPAR